MASDESSTVLSSVDDFLDPDADDGYDLHSSHPHSHHNLSRLSVCTSSMYTNDGDDDEDSAMSRIFMSGLSIDSFDADAELSDQNPNRVRPNPTLGPVRLDLISSDSDSDKEPGCYSLPSTPPRRRNRGGPLPIRGAEAAKEYASENEGGKKGVSTGRKLRRNPRRRRLVSQERWTDGGGESENGGGGGGGGGGGLVVITRPKGGSRPLCMDLGEVKACKDLGFELEHERMVSVSGTSSGGNSPIANWRISSPGDDPRDVKARLKVWAQAVAFASSTGKQGGGGGAI
ncbi:unnamed protein product [Linum tenue]|uniref:Pectinacetylesterase family protein n=1 Tax=Linum tenue TaxID=586396 RepID=A0AAV0PGZ6_9ROSI|nr:unnamed protein product [Linum tenue]